MAAVNIKAFRGAIPRVGSRLLQPNQASTADNCKLTSGNLEPLNGPLLVHTSQLADVQAAYFWRALVDGRVEDNWLAWESDVDVVKSLVPNDALQRFYFSSAAFEPRISTYPLAIDSLPYPTAWYALGVTAPSAAPTVGVTGGSGTLESRAYAYTFVTALGEESPPSPPSAVTDGYPDGTWTLTSIQTAPPNSGTVATAASINPNQVRVTLNTTTGLAQYDMITFTDVEGMTDLNGTFRIQSLGPTANTLVVNLATAQTYTTGGAWDKPAPHNITGMTKRIYRTTGTGGDFLFVAEIAVATTTYEDAVEADDLGEVLPTTLSSPPPKNMTSLTSLPNGCLVGIAGNEICFSEPYMPYSWPSGNRYTFSGVGVDLVAAGNSVIVLTDSFPILFTGTDPEAMSPAIMQTYAPCASKRSVADVGGGAMYASYDGLWIAAPGRVEKLTSKIFREEEWRLLNPTTFVSGFSDGIYYAAYTTDDRPYILMYDTAENDSVVRVQQDASYLIRNETDGELYFSLDNKVYRWDSNVNQRYSSDWVSSEMQMPRPMNFAVAQVHGAYNAIVPVDTSVLDANTAIFSDEDLVGGELNGNSILALEINGSNLAQYEASVEAKAQFTLYADGELVFAKAISSSEPFRLPAGFRSEVYQVGLSTSIPIYNVTIAESVAELAQAST